MDGFNRFFLFVVGLALIAAAVAILGTAAGLFDALGLPSLLPPDELMSQARRSAASWDWPIWTAVLLALLALTALALWLAVRQLAPRQQRPPPEVTLDRTERGETRVSPARIAAAGERELRAVDGVLGARLRMIEMGSVPLVDADVKVEHGTSIERVLSGTEQVFARMARAVGVDDVRAVLRVRHVDPVPQETPSRVR